MNRCILFLIITSLSFVSLAQDDAWSPNCWGDWQFYGNQHDGTYRNPVLPADFSDIDCISYNGEYYAISSTFQLSPGMVILRSRNMVDWEICSHAVTDIRQIGAEMNYDRMDRYGKGIWAGAIRHHNGLFYVYFGTPDEGIFVTSSKDINGPWSDLVKVIDEGGWDDPCPLFDEDGKNYLVATHFADGYKTYIFPMAEDGLSIDKSRGVLVNEGMGREANKLYKINGMYYHLYSEATRDGRYLMMKRSETPMGPYSQPKQLSYTQRHWHEPNQGGLLQDADGQWYFLTHHGTGDWGGRIASLLPVTWQDGWPVIGEPDDRGIGNMVWHTAVPSVTLSKTSINRSQGFHDPCWSWNYHPREGYFKVSKTALTLKAFQPLEANNLLKAGNTLLQRSWQVPWSVVTVRLDISKFADGQRSGLCHLSRNWSEFGIEMEKGIKSLYIRTGDNQHLTVAQAGAKHVYLRSSWDLSGLSTYSYSFDGKDFTEVDFVFPLSWGNYRGDQFGLYTYNNNQEAGSATFDKFSYEKLPEAPTRNVFGHALLPDMIADASIMEYDSTFYCYATTDGMGHGLSTSGMPVVWKSNDFVNWSFDGCSFPLPEGTVYWAPSKAVRKDGKWYLYPTLNVGMYPAVADSPEGPFRLAKGDSLVIKNRLWPQDNVHYIDAEIFIDDDGKGYAFWSRRNVGLLNPDMVTIDSLVQLPTRHNAYTEGPIFFKRNGIYYYLYTQGGSETYTYRYQMSRVSPLGPWIYPDEDLVCATDVQTGVYGPGHGCVFKTEGTDDYYIAFLEFGRNSTNRQTYVNRLEFNEDGTIQKVKVTLDGVGALHPVTLPEQIYPASVTASSVATPQKIQYFNDDRCQRVEHFDAAFVSDDANGSRWMAAENDTTPWIMMDLGSEQYIGTSEAYFVRPTTGHAYRLESSTDGKVWTTIGGHTDLQQKSPHTDMVGKSCRYLRLHIDSGIKGLWEWKLRK